MQYLSYAFTHIYIRFRMLNLSCADLWRFSRVVVAHFSSVLDKETPRQIKGMMSKADVAY